MSRHIYRSRTRQYFAANVIWRRQSYKVNPYLSPGQGRWESPLVSGKTPGTVIPLSEVLDGWVGKRAEIHPVFHMKEDLRVEPVSYSYGPPIGGSLAVEANARLPEGYFTWSSTSYEYNGALTIGGISIVANAPASWGPAPDWRKAYEALLDDVHGLLPAQKSIAVNVAEFTQLKRLVPGIAKSVKRLLNWMKRDGNRTIRVQYRRGRRHAEVRYKTVTVNSGAWCLRDLAQLHLANSFGVMPLASDVGELAAKLYEVQIHHNWYKAMTDGESHTVRATVNNRVSRTNEGSGDRNVTFKDIESCEMKSVLSARVRITPESSSVQQRRYFNQILGVNVPLQIAWELVPFSFVVDWFLPVGEVLSRFEPKQFFGSLAAKVLFQERWFSMKTVAKVERSCRADYKPDRFGRANQYVIREGGKSVRTLTTYTRQTGWPELNWMPPKGSFGFKQAGLSLALVVTRLFK